MTDTEILDALESVLRKEDPYASRSIIVLNAWWSGGAAPDGFGCTIGDLELDANEHPTLREAIVEALQEARHVEG